MPSLSPQFRRILRYVLAVAIGIGGSWLGMAVWGSSTSEMGPFEVRMSAQFGAGTTDIVLPPLGQLSANTHTAPLHIRATLLDVRINELSDAIAHGGVSALVQRVAADADTAVRYLAIRVLLIGVATAVVLAVLAFRRDRHALGIAALAAVVAIGGTEVVAIATYHRDAFAAPTYSGSLALAAKVIPPARTVEQIDAYQEQLTRVIDGAIGAYTSIRTNDVGGKGEIRVLHISDIHLSPLGFDFARQIASGFDVDFVLDTGDTTSFGTEPENFVTQDIAAFHLPYVWVRGNHDSRRLQHELSRIPNVHVLDGTSIVVDGLRIYGLGDPIPPSITRSIPDDVFEARVRAQGPRILSDLASLPPVDIIAVHDDRMAEAAAGRVPLVLSGHFHQEEVRVIDGTLFLRVGTTGGSALTTFEPDVNIPLTAEVLYFAPGTPPSLIAYDVIQQNVKTGSLTVTRHTISNEYGALTPSPVPTTESPTGTPVSGTRTPVSGTPRPVATPSASSS
ncbi:MAG: metallophosphoesterase family protein [Actinomycetota bacterium]